MVGLPGSGKSTKAQELARQYNGIVLSSDTIRKTLTGSEADQSKNEIVFRELYSMMREMLKEGKTVIIDATNVSLKGRLHTLRETRGIPCQKIAYVVNTPVDVCIQRDLSRDRTVGVDVIKKYERSFIPPQYFEGFDDIIIDKIEPHNPAALSYIMSNMKNFNQRNPHHLYSLYEHCVKLANNYPQHCEEHFAGTVHDVGKLYTQVIDDAGIAHYYNHDSVEAYYLISHTELVPSGYDIMYVLFLVAYHMRAHRDIAIGTKAGMKYKQLFGDFWYKQLMRFAENDRKASGTYKSVGRTE